MEGRELWKLKVKGTDPGSGRRQEWQACGQYPVPKYLLPQNLESFPFTTLLKINLNYQPDTLIRKVNVEAIRAISVYKVVSATSSFQQLLLYPFHRENEKFARDKNMRVL